MLQIKRILCAVDLHKPAQAALSHAVWLADTFKAARLDLVNVSLASDAGYSSLSPNSCRVEQMMVEHNGRERLDRLLDGVASNVVARATAHVLQGKPIPQILAYAQASNADLIVLGVGQSWAFTRLVLGGIAEQVIHGTLCPVLTVRDDAAPDCIERILVPVDFSSCTDVALDWAAALAERFGARLELLHVSSNGRPPGVSAGASAEQRARSDDLSPHTRLTELAQRARWRGADVGDMMVTDGRISGRILELAASGAYDLIVMGLHPARRGMRVLGTGVGCAVRVRASIPVLSVRPDHRQPVQNADASQREASRESSISALQAREPGSASCSTR